MPLFGQQREQLAKIRLERRQEGDDRPAQTVIENGPFALFGRSVGRRERARALVSPASISNETNRSNVKCRPRRNHILLAIYCVESKHGRNRISHKKGKIAKSKDLNFCLIIKKRKKRNRRDRNLKL